VEWRFVRVDNGRIRHGSGGHHPKLKKGLQDG